MWRWIFFLSLCSVNAQLMDRFVPFDRWDRLQHHRDQINTSPRFTVIAPDVLRADSDQTLVLLGDGVSSSDQVPVEVQVWDFSRSSILTQSSTTLSPSNGHYTLHTIRVPSLLLNPEEKKEKFVFLKVTFGESEPQEQLLLVSFHQGFLFVQTDRPVYCPGQPVRYRAFISSLDFKATDGTITIEIKNPDGIVVHHSSRRTTNGIWRSLFPLSELASEGLWTVTARFNHWEQNTFNSTFEVKKYVLPAFNVTLTPQKPYFSVDDKELIFTITARFLYGQPVVGRAYIMFGVKHEREKIRLRPMKQLSDLDGGRVSLTADEIRAEYPDLRSLVGKSLYAKASVLTHSGGDLVEVEKGGVHIVISPFVVSFKDAPKYFKPGMPLDLTLLVHHHDDSPVQSVTVKLTFLDSPLEVTAGSAHISINMPNTRTPQTITVETVQPGLRAEQQARRELQVAPYSPPGRPLNLLHISAVRRRVAVGESLRLLLSLSLERPQDLRHVQSLTYMVLNKGRIVSVRREVVRSQPVVGVQLLVSSDMMPSFRVVAFYSLPWTREEEVVSDSIYVEVQNSCVGKLTVGQEGHASDLRPGKTLKLRIEGDAGSTVSLVSVDSSVYLLRRDRLSQSQVWGTVEGGDLGCSRGGGGGSARGVFSDAGLHFNTNSGFKTHFRQTLQCPRSSRWRRSVDRLDQKAQLEREYQDQQLRRCCLAGVRMVPMPYSCTRRSLYITEGAACVRAFRHCCGTYHGETIDTIMPTAWPAFITTTLPPTTTTTTTRAPRGGWERVDVMAYGRIQLSPRMETFIPYKKVQSRVLDTVVAPRSPNIMSAARQSPGPPPPPPPQVEEVEEEGEEDWETLDETMVDLRSQFHESWLWEEVSMPTQADSTSSMVSLSRPLPDTITEWSVMAVSASSETGFCVAEPLLVRAWKPLFVDLKLPYSVTRNEQVQIPAVIYNYSPEDKQVRVTLMKTELMCSLAFRGRYTQDVTVSAGSSLVLPLSLVPLEVGMLPLEVLVVSRDQMLSDRVQKTLRVVVEGVQKTKVWSVVLDPAAEGGTQTLRMGKVELDSVVPNSVPETIVNIRGDLLADSLENSLSQDSLAALIQMPGGCVEQNLASMSLPTIAFLYLDRTQGWAKTGAHRRDLALGYIRNGYTNQLAYRRKDGSYPPYRKQGASTWITAFVVKVFSVAHSIIGLEELQVCEPLWFLLRHRYRPDLGVFIEENPVYSTTMTGGLRGDDPQTTLTAFVLIAMAEAKLNNIQCNTNDINTEEVIRNTASHLQRALRLRRRPYTVAIAAYALSLITDLSIKERRDNLKEALMRASSAGRSRWEDQENPLFSLEASGYALLTLLRLDALTEAAPVFKWLNSQRRRGGGYGSTQPTVVVLQALSQYMVQQPPPQTLDLNLDLKLGARSVPCNFNHVTSYSARSERLSANADLEVKAWGTGKGILEVVTYYNQLHEVEERLSCKHFLLQVTIDQSAETPPPEVVNMFLMTIKVRALGPRDVRMVVLDLTLPTGFTPVNADLDMLSNSVDKYLANFKMVDNLSDRGSLILHLFKVSHKEPEILIFKLHQNFKVGNLQPSSVTVYEYYNPDRRCSRTFTPALKEKPEQLTHICLNKGDCCVSKSDSENFSNKERETFACTALHHVFKVKVLNVTQSFNDEYETEITEVIKLGSEAAVVPGLTRSFMSHGSCRDSLTLTLNQEYLIIGPTSDQRKTDNTRVVYLLGKDTWVERWPSAEECVSTFRQKCESLIAMATELYNNACRL